MPATIRFHLDEHISSAVAVGLRQHGLDVTTSAEANLLGGADDEQIAYAVEHERVIVTNDSDFLRHHQRGGEHYGIAYCQQGRRPLGEMIRRLAALANRCSPQDMQNHVEFL